jgi:hypothetical protein
MPAKRRSKKIKPSQLTALLEKFSNEEDRTAPRTTGYLEDGIYLVEEAIDRAEKAKASEIVDIGNAVKTLSDFGLLTEDNFRICLMSLVRLSYKLDYLQDQLSKRIKTRQETSTAKEKKIAKLWKKRRGHLDDAMYG